MKRTLTTFILLGNFYGACLGQKTGDLKAYLDDFIDEMPQDGTDEYRDPTGEETTSFYEAFRTMQEGNLEEAASGFEQMGYNLVSFEDDASDRIYYIVEEATDAGSLMHGGIFVYCPSCPNDQVVMQSPHGRKDFRTGPQAVHVFHELGLQLWMGNSSHRCNSTTASSCDGQSSVCGNGRKPYPISDAAHNDQSLLQVATRAVYEHHQTQGKSIIFIQPHGFNRDSRPDGFPHVILSYGTKLANDSGPDFTGALRQGFESVSEFDIAEYHLDPDIQELGGTTNVMGRYLNGSSDACDIAADENSLSFIHIEQSMDVRENFDFLTAAVEHLLKEFATQEDPTAIDNEQQSLVIYQSLDGSVQYIRQSSAEQKISIYSLQGRLVHEEHLDDTFGSIDIQADPGLYLYHSGGRSDVFGKFMIK